MVRVIQKSNRRAKLLDSQKTKRPSSIDKEPTKISQKNDQRTTSKMKTVPREKVKMSANERSSDKKHVPSKTTSTIIKNKKTQKKRSDDEKISKSKKHVPDVPDDVDQSPSNSLGSHALSRKKTRSLISYRVSHLFSRLAKDRDDFLKNPVCKGIMKPTRILKNGLDREATLARSGIMKADGKLMIAISHAIDKQCKQLSRQLYVVSLSKILNNTGNSSVRIMEKDVSEALQNMGHSCLFARIPT